MYNTNGCSAKQRAETPAPSFNAGLHTWGKWVWSGSACLSATTAREGMSSRIASRVLEGTSAQGHGRGLHLMEANAAASLHTTADDYARLMAGWLADSALMARVLAAPVPVDPALGLAWGLGWGIETAAGGPYLWQWGNNPGFRAFAMVSVTSGDGFVLLTNSERGMPLAASLAQATVPAQHGVFRFGMLG